MKHFGKITGLITALILPFLVGGQAFAATISASQQIIVTAIVPAHRDIILNNIGQIVEIDSNTNEDVTPTVYRLSAVPDNKMPLTAGLLSQYRQYVPLGTAKYGVLYKQSPLAIVSNKTPVFSGMAHTTSSAADISMLFKPASSETFATTLRS